MAAVLSVWCTVPVCAGWNPGTQPVAVQGAESQRGFLALRCTLGPTAGGSLLMSESMSTSVARCPGHAPAQVVRLSAHTVRVIPVGDSSNATRETDGGCQAQHEPRGQWRQREQRRSRPSNFGGAAGTGLQRLWWMPLRHPYGLVVVVGPAVLVGVAFPGPVQERHRSQGHRSRLQSPEVPGVPGVPAA